MQVATIGLDTSKHVFQVHGVDAKGRLVCRRKLRRNQLAAYFANLPCCLIGLEACGGAHYWARRLSRLGHTVRLMAPQFVKPYVKSNKNDANDAEAIGEAVSRPTMRFVPTKCVAQQDWQMLHRVRSRLIGTRTQLSNQIRGLALMKSRDIENNIPRGQIADGCLLCSEEEPHHCHRRLVAEYLREKWTDLEIVHIV